MTLTAIFKQLVAHEGLRLKPYPDTVGKLTIGYGRNLSDRGISKDEAELLLMHDLQEAIAAAGTYPWFAGLDPVRQRVVVDMLFNLGATKFRKFVGTIAAIASGDYVKASAHMLNSLWARQVGARATRLARMMATGEDL